MNEQLSPNSTEIMRDKDKDVNEKKHRNITDFSLFDLEVNHIFSAYDKITYKGIEILKVKEHKECNDENFDIDAFATAAWENGEYAGECHDIILKGPIDIESVKPK